MKRFDAIAEDSLQPLMHVPRHPLALARLGLRSLPSADMLARIWCSREAQGLFGGLAAHGFRPFSSPFSSAIGVTLGTAAHHYGWPVAEGGSQSIANAMASALRQRLGKLSTGTTVTALDELAGSDIVLLDVAPQAAARICGTRLPARIRRSLERFRYGPAAFKVDFAVEGGVPWTYLPACDAGTVHVGGSLAEIRSTEASINRGVMPERPFVLVCQQSVADPTRADNGVHPVYSYAHVPSGYPGDATAAVEAQIERFAPGFRSRILRRAVRTVAATEAGNPNYVGGDITTGSNDPRQLFFRPRIAHDPYDLGIPGVFICSAATPPGAGAHGMCGYNAARSAIRFLNRGLR